MIYPLQNQPKLYSKRCKEWNLNRSLNMKKNIKSANMVKFLFVLLFQVIKIKTNIWEILTQFFSKITTTITSFTSMTLPKMALPKKLKVISISIKCQNLDFYLFKTKSIKKRYPTSIMPQEDYVTVVKLWPSLMETITWLVLKCLK